jgi:hypothetical protein
MANSERYVQYRKLIRGSSLAETGILVVVDAAVRGGTVRDSLRFPVEVRPRHRRCQHFC